MDISSHKKIQKECADKAQYFAKIDFSVIADNFQKAADALQELITAIEKLNNLDENVSQEANE